MTEEQNQEQVENAGSAVEASAEPTDEVAELRRQLDEARARADETHRSWQRTAADFANFKRRVDEEKRFAERWLLQDLLPVLDDFERAWATAPRELVKLTWLEGLLQINSKLFGVLQRHGVTPIEADGAAFNPIEHEAVLRDEQLDASEQTHVVADLQRGYRLHDRVLRASLVKVGRPVQQASDEQPLKGEQPSSGDQPTSDTAAEQLITES
jgi:molecular chaperone GrpE